MLKHLILISAVALWLSACSKDDEKGAGKPPDKAAATGKTTLGPDDIAATPVAPDPAAKPTDQAGDPDKKSAVADPAGAGEPAKKVGADKLPDPGAKKTASCVSECVRRNQMRAVGPDQIEAECKTECAKTNKCVTDCVERNKMRAVGADVIDADCKKECAKK